MPVPLPPPLRLRSARINRRVRKAMAHNITREEIRAARAQPDHGWLTLGAGRAGGVLRPAPLRQRPAGRLSPATRDAVLVSLPRRRQSKYEAAVEAVPPPMRATNAPRVSSGLFLRRLAVWLWVCARFAAGTLWDVLRRRNSPDRQAARMRRIAERTGGTLVKIGQLAALRLDVLPVCACEQLALMRDRMPPFATADAVGTVERRTRRRLNEVFSRFDPAPVGSSSIHCVYQAVLRESGEKVVVKVRRPGIDAAFEADFQALLFLARAAESLSLVHSGYAVGVCRDLQNRLRAELDFRRGARLEELFGRRARRAKLRFYSAPRVYNDLSSDEVLVQEFESGMWLWEVLAAVERGDATGLAYMRTLNIDPRKLARRLLLLNNWAAHEHLTFHADPRPANIVVRANSRLTFVESAANGYISKSRKQLFQRFHACRAGSDIWGMAQATVALFEPLPARDLNALAKEIEAAYYEQTLAVKSGHAAWHERASAALWLAAFKIMRKYRIPAPADVLLYARATLFHETLAARLWPAIDYAREYRRYRRGARRRWRARGARQMRRRLREGLVTGSDFRALQAASTTVDDLLFRLQRILAAPYDFEVLPLTVEKWVYLVVTFVQFLTRSAALALAGVLLVAAYEVATNQPVALETIWQPVLGSGLYLAAVALLALQCVRLILFRLGDRRRQEQA